MEAQLISIVANLVTIAQLEQCTKDSIHAQVAPILLQIAFTRLLNATFAPLAISAHQALIDHIYAQLAIIAFKAQRTTSTLHALVAHTQGQEDLKLAQNARNARRALTAMNIK